MSNIFIWIPKTGGTSIYSILQKYGGVKYKKTPFYFNNEELVTFAHMSPLHLVKEGWLDKTFYDDAFKFCFVRNPFDRLVSLYFYRKRTKSPIEKMTFKEFCFFVQQSRLGVGAYNYKGISQSTPQIEWAKNADFVGRFENLQEDFDFICEKLNIPKQKLPIKNTTKHKHYNDYYDAELIELVSEIYKEDLLTFNYGV